jgi:hypothetical protein
VITSDIAQFHQCDVALRPNLLLACAGRLSAELSFSVGLATILAPFSQRRKASQWIAAMILNVTNGSAANARASATEVSRRRSPLNAAARTGPSASVSRIRSRTTSPGGVTRK